MAFSATAGRKLERVHISSDCSGDSGRREFKDLDHSAEMDFHKKERVAL